MSTFPFLLASFLLLVALGCSSPPPEAGIDPSDREQVARGERIYHEHCAVCHGVELEGEPNWRQRRPDGRLPAPPHDESGHTWHHPNTDLFRMTRDGMVPPFAPEGYESDMPAFGDILDDDEIRAVLAYIQSTWSSELHAMRRDMLDEGTR